VSASLHRAGRPRAAFTVARFFALLLGLTAAFAALGLVRATATASQAVVAAGTQAQQQRIAEVAASVERDLDAAPAAISEVEAALGTGLVDFEDDAGLARALRLTLLAHPNLVELTLTSAERLAVPQDELRIAPSPRRQICLYRDGHGVIHEKRLRARAGAADDPTRHPTFTAAAAPRTRGALLWSDLALSELDRDLPESARRKTVTAQKALHPSDPAMPGEGRDLGATIAVLRAGLVSATLDRLGQAGPAVVPRSRGDVGDDHAHAMFLADEHGRLVSRVRPSDRYVTLDEGGAADEDGDLRVDATTVPAPVQTTLALAAASGSIARDAVRTVRQHIAGETWLLSLRPVATPLPERWLVAVAVPERVYVAALLDARNRLFGWVVLTLLALGALAWTGARTVSRGMRALIATTHAMQRLSFEPAASERSSPFGDVRAALANLEQAKTALRAMAKYVPLPIVRQLFTSGQEPVPGASLRPVTVMFTDIADFTHHAERLSPAVLGEALGIYLEAATAAVESFGGTVDKYIGDALMVLWNAPADQEHHVHDACRGALACAARTTALATTATWKRLGLPPWHTRIGLHTDRVLVGHFGAPSRLNYTAIGDGVNLAARLEGLNKVYGTSILVSEDVRTAAEGAFLFRLVDRVAVKGKEQPVAVYELGPPRLPDVLPAPAGPTPPSAEAQAQAFAATAQIYEAALAAAWRRDFAAALSLLQSVPHDPPARELRRRCETWSTSPPASEWDGTWHAPTK
jgi:adenylate cyclase